MDERFTIHAERAPLLAFGPEAPLVPEVVIDAVDHIEAESASGAKSALPGAAAADGKAITERP